MQSKRALFSLVLSCILFTGCSVGEYESKKLETISALKADQEGVVFISTDMGETEKFLETIPDIEYKN
ncbi:hypothetical protein [Alkalihalobacterium sp. APHAB7]|uniref:hypothetical protein n=1 Tax=Alkalihalobacterium sp. APHAB7 TaxID=3402081 RepID=UPI003AAF62EB